MSNDVLLVANAPVLTERAVRGENNSQDNQQANNPTSHDSDVIMPLKLSGPPSKYAPHAHTETNNKNMSTYVPNVILLGRKGEEEVSPSQNSNRSLSSSSDSSDKQRESATGVPASEESLDISTTTYSDINSDSGDSSSTSTTTSVSGSPARSEKDSFDHTNTTDTGAAHSSNTDNASALSVKAGNVMNSFKSKFSEFSRFRIQYLIVHTAIMLADGLQGTHLYVLYEGYGYSVSSLYSLGFVAGALSSPLIGPIVDNIGRKKAAMLYCCLEIMINYLELFPIFAGLITSRIIGGITTNLLFTVFESWLVSEHRRRGFEEEKLEIILRDSTIVSNSAAIVSGYLAHCLASSFGPVGPFQGAVVLTGLALLLAGAIWNENYGSSSNKTTTWRSNMAGAYKTIVSDSKILRIGLIQGLSEGSLQTFVFLWSPALRAFAQSSPKEVMFLDLHGEPAYGLIFGAFMACGVVGGFVEPYARKALTRFTTIDGKDKTDSSNPSLSNTSTISNQDQSQSNNDSDDVDVDVDDDGGDGELKPVAVDFLCTLCYLSCACLFMTPFLLNKNSPYSFLACVGAFLVYELMVGLYMPCEGVIRSIYMPNESICSLMTMLRVIVNVAVALGVISTNYVPFTSAFAALSVMMVVAAILQISLISRHELVDLFDHFTQKWSTSTSKTGKSKEKSA